MKKAIILALIAVSLLLGNTAFATSEALLKRGHRGQEVREIQIALGVKPTGTFGKRTHKSVRVFQQRNNLRVDGIVGPQTRGALFPSKTEDGSKPEPKTEPEVDTHKADRTASSDMSKTQIIRLQIGLEGLGFPSLRTGTLDLVTMKSYTTWQAASWWPVIDYRGRKGVVTERQIVKIERQVDKTKADAPSFCKKILLQVSCIATVFGYKDKDDNGKGSPLLHPSGPKYCINTNDAHRKGVALPERVITKLWKIKPARYTKKGNPVYRWEDWSGVRSAGVYVFSNKTNDWHGPYTIDDVGPGNGPQKKGVGIDLCNGAKNEIRGSGWDKVQYRVVSNVFPERAG